VVAVAHRSGRGARSCVLTHGIKLGLNQVLRRREWGLGCGLACGCWGFGVVGLGVVPG
jgi:hypothetical protein